MGGGRQRTEVRQELSPEQQRILQLVFPVAERFIAEPPQLPERRVIQPFNPLEQLAQQQALRIASSVAPGLARAGMGAAGALLSRAAPGDPTVNAAVRAAIEPVREEFTERILPTLRRGAVAANVFGSPKYAAQEQAAVRAFGRAAMREAGRIALEGGRQALGALGQLPAVTALQTLPAQMVADVGAAQRGLAQQMAAEEIRRELAQRFLPLQVAQAVANLTFGVPTPTVTEAVGGPGMGARIAGGIGGALSGAATGAMLAGALGGGGGGAAAGAAAGAGLGPWGIAAGALLGLIAGMLR